LLELSPDVVLLTYRSAGLTAEGSARDYSHRVSIWKKGGMYWRIIFHQGTAVEAFELVA
jgi:hypothetical protein